MRLLWRYARSDPGRSLATLGCLLLAALAEALSLSSLLPLLQLSSPDGSPAPAKGYAAVVASAFDAMHLAPTPGVLLAFIVGGALVKSALLLVANRQVGYTVAHVASDLRLRLVRALLGARWEYYARQPVGALANAFSVEADRAAAAYLFGATMTAAAIQSAIYVAIACAVSWHATVGALVVGGFTVAALHRLVRNARRSGARQTQLLKSSASRLTDALHGVKPLKAMAREELLGPLLERETERLNRATRIEVLSKEALKALQEPILVIALAVGVYFALTRWQLPLPTLLMTGLLFQRTLTAMNRVQREYQGMATREQAYASLHATVTRAESQREAPTRGAAPSFEREIALRDVSLAYEDRVALDGVSLSIPARAITALVGPSGAGKTSIADLVVGLVRPQRGDVFLDDLPLGEVDLRRWRGEIGYVPQEMFLLHDTVFANVTLGEAGLGARDVEDALRAAGAWEFVSALPEGVDTVVGERGALLSGGQRQRIAIARALVHRPRLLILDEATTALDPATEAAVCASLAQLRGRLTVLAISHQRALVELADRVYRIEHGVAKPA